jgi:hypothetical protein
MSVNSTRLHGVIYQKSVHFKRKDIFDYVAMQCDLFSVAVSAIADASEALSIGM